MEDKLPLLNYTTEVPAERTASEIMRILTTHGAKDILTSYDEAGKLVALAFRARTTSGVLPFRLPINDAAVLKILEQQWESGHIPRRFANPAQAHRVAWRIIKEWVLVQMALIETEMVKLEEVFLPYMIMGEKTMFQHMTEQRFQLSAPVESDTEEEAE